MDDETYSRLWKFKRVTQHLRRRCHASHCVVCGKEFKRNDKVYDDVAVTFHEDCLNGYIEQSEELGLR